MNPRKKIKHNMIHSNQEIGTLYINHNENIFWKKLKKNIL